MNLFPARNSAPQPLPTLLVVTPTLGSSAFLEETIHSVRELPFPVFHVLSCPEHRLQDLTARFPFCKVIQDAGLKGGIYGALNAALSAVISDDWEWFTYINDDDAIGPGFATALQSHLSRPSPEPIVYGNVRLINEVSHPIGWITTEKDPSRLHLLLHQSISPLNQQGMLMRRDVVYDLNSFDLRYSLCSDLDFWVRALQAGFAFRFTPHEVGRFRIRRGQLSANTALTRSEFRDIVNRHLGSPPGFLALALSRMWYRATNLPRYLERLRISGPKTSEAILQNGH